MELLEVDAKAFWQMSSIVGQFLIRLDAHHISEEILRVGVGNLAQMEAELPKLGLPSAEKQLERLKAAILGTEEERKPPLAWRPMLIDLIQRVFDELDGRFFLFLSPDSVPLYRQTDPSFGAAVEAKFPEMAEDISEAATCLALSRSTASVFHLMRVMEIALQKFGESLGVALASEKNWQNILDEINKAIKRLDPKASQTIAYAGAAAHLYNVKVTWRNPTMHPKQTYTPDEARNIFSAVKTFIGDLSGLL
jgi:hypothetical protein